MNGLTWRLCRRFLFGRPGGSSTFRRVRGGVLGIALSLIPLVVVFVVANGMISGITLRFLETGTYHLKLNATQAMPLEDMYPLARTISEMEGVRSASVEVQGLALLAGGRGHGGVQLRGIDPQLYEKDSGFARYMRVVDGEFDLQTPRSLLIGDKLASVLDISPGDKVRVITVVVREGGRLVPKVSRFTVTGVVSSGYRELDGLWAFVTAAEAMRVLPSDEIRQTIGIKSDDPFSGIRQAGDLGFDGSGDGQLFSEIRSHIDSSWRLFNWFDLERSQYMSFITTRNLLLFIMVLVVVVATVNISSTMIMLVLEKQEEIAMLKAMGMGNSSLLFLFLLSGGITGIIGTIIGLGLGVIAAFNVNDIIAGLEWAVNGLGYIHARLFSPKGSYVPLELFNPDFYLSRIPVSIRPRDILVMARASFLLSVLMSFLPAMRALKINPAQLLHRR